MLVATSSVLLIAWSVKGVSLPSSTHTLSAVSRPTPGGALYESVCDVVATGPDTSENVAYGVSHSPHTSHNPAYGHITPNQ